MNKQKLTTLSSLTAISAGIYCASLMLAHVVYAGMSDAPEANGHGTLFRFDSFTIIGLGIALLGTLVLVLISYKIRQHGKDPVVASFEKVDSTTLDANPRLFEQFYSMAYNYRAEHGHKKYQKVIINRFKFFYEFHNKALHLIDDLFNQSARFPPPRDFVLSILKSGHIGPIFTDITYEGGVSGLGLRKHTPLFAYANLDSIDLWSTKIAYPILSLNKKQFDLKRPNRTGNYVTAVLSAEMKNTYQTIKITLGFPEFHYDLTQDKVHRHDIVATQNYHMFQRWLNDCCPKQNASANANFGISVEHNYDVEYGIPAPELLQHTIIVPSLLPQVLQALTKTRIDAYFTRHSMPILRQKSAMDALVLCSGLGLVVITDQQTTGQVSYNGDAGWIVHENNRSQIIENACVRANKAKKSLKRFLTLNNLENWPIISLVVFSAHDVELLPKPGHHRLQCDVVRLSELERWFSSNASTNTSRFTKNDYNQLALLLGNKSRQYRPRLKEA